MTPSTSRTSSPSFKRGMRIARTTALAALLASSLSACVPLVLGAAAGGAWVAVDRRSSGAQADDEALEIRGKNRIKEALNKRGRIDVTSYNRIVLLTGQVPTQADKDLAFSTAQGLPNARSVINEITIGNNPTASYARDAMTSTRVRTALVGSRNTKAKPVKVTTENGTVYLMGIVTQQESDRAAEVASGVKGVSKVVKVFEIMDSSGINNAVFLGLDAQTNSTSAPAPTQSTDNTAGTHSTP